MTDLVAEARAALRTLGVLPRKRMGQNFMVGERPLQEVVRALQLHPAEPVLEIGPGLGFLTARLLEKGAEVIAVEKDSHLALYLERHFKGRPLRVIEKDILKFDLERDLGPAGPIQVAGNIPYHITSPLLEWLVSQRRWVSAAVLTVQWEVAQRLTARPGGRDWGALSVFVRFHGDVRLITKVAPHDFYPAPKVDSAVVRVDFPSKAAVPVTDVPHFFKVVRLAFQKRRKMLLNSLSGEGGGSFPKSSVLEALARAGIDPARRAETLSIPEWAVLSERLSAEFKT